MASVVRLRLVLLKSLLVLLALSALSCDRSPPAHVNPAAAGARETVADVKPVAQLPPNRTVHVAVDSLNNLFYTVETPDGQDGVVVVGDNGVPRATRLTSGNILAAMGESAGGSGTIQDLAAGPDDTFYFYFIGGKGKTLRACIGIYVPRSSEAIAILFDTASIASLSGMGPSLDLARAALLVSDNTAWLFLRHTDAFAIFRFEARLPSPGFRPELQCPFTKVWADDDSLELTRIRYQLSPGVGGHLLLCDTSSGILWDVDSYGRAKLNVLLTGLPRELSRPVVLKDKRLLFFAADSEPIEADLTEALHRRLPSVSYPALLEVSGKEIKALVGRDQFHVPGGVAAYALRIRQLCRTLDGSYLGYDQASGQIVQMRLREQ